MLFIFLISCLLSFLGSLQPGPVNLAVVASSILHSRMKAILIALGGSLPEFGYALLAFYTSSYLHFAASISAYIQLGIALLLVVFGMMLFVSKQADQLINVLVKRPFISGLSLAIFNPQLYLFWLAMFTYLQAKNYLIQLDNYSAFAASAGAFTGAIILHLLLISGSKLVNMQSFKHYANKIAGFVLIACGLFQLANIAFNGTLKVS